MRIGAGGATAALLFLAVAAGGCSSSSDNGTGTGGTGGCALVLSGTVSLDATCNAPTAGFDASSEETTLGISALDLTGGYSVSADILIQAPLTANTTYTGGDNILAAAVDLARASDNATWVASSTNDPAQNVGTISLAITSVTTTSTVNGVSIYAVHGTLTATLPAQTGSAASGSVMVKATF